MKHEIVFPDDWPGTDPTDPNVDLASLLFCLTHLQLLWVHHTHSCNYITKNKNFTAELWSHIWKGAVKWGRYANKGSRLGSNLMCCFGNFSSSL